MFYKVDSTRVTMREFSVSTPLLLWPIALPIFGLMKILRIRVDGSPDDPNVEWLSEHEVPRQKVPQDLRTRFEPLEAELAELGFESPVFHQWHDRSQHTQFHLETQRHSSGQAFGRLHHKHWSFPTPQRDYLFAIFVSEFDDGSFLVSTAGKKDLFPVPPNVVVQRLAGASATKLWAAHQSALQRETLARSPVPIRDARDLDERIERFQSTLRDFHVERGAFVPLPTKLSSETPVPASTSDTDNLELVDVIETDEVPILVADGEPVLDEQHVSVIEEIRRQQKKRGGWLGAIALLVVSAVVFVGAGAAQWDWKSSLLLVPILLFHEAGHWVAMKVFGYRNLKMFFIPFFGAGVSGRSYNVAGWKKAVVALAGPLPGVWLSIVLGVVALIVEKPQLLDVALLALILNSFNLLPILPLDGGQNLHAVLFSRHPILDIVFRAAASLALMGGSVLLGDKFLFYLGLVMLFSLPIAFKTMKIVSKLRDEQLDTQATADESVPIATAVRIVDELRAVLSPQQQQNKLLAKLTLDVFESLNSRPPGVFGSLTLLAAHGGTFLMAIVFAMVFVVGKHGNLGDLVRQAANMPQQSYQCGSSERWEGADAARDLDAERQTLVANFRDEATATATHRDLTGRLPPFATATRFGQTLFVTLPAADDESRKLWLQELEKTAQHVVVGNKEFQVTLRLTCIARSAEEAQKLEEELQEYFQCPAEMWLIPPWSSRGPLSADQRQARRTYQRALKTEHTYDDPQAKEFVKPMAQARKQGDKKELDRLVKLQQERFTAARQENRDRLKRELSDKLSQDVLERYELIPQWEPDLNEDNAEGAANRAEKLKAFTEKRHAALRHVGELLGQVPLENEQPSGRDRLELAQNFFVSRNGLLLSIPFISFTRTDHGLPRMAEWLCGKGCLDVKYAINNFGANGVGNLDLD